MKQVIRGDWSKYQDGVYWASNNVWNSGGLRNGSDYRQTVSFDTATFPNRVEFAWSWPNVFNDSIFSYPEIGFGRKPWNDFGSRDYSTRVDELRTFRIRYDTEIAGQTDKFNVAFSLWLTDKPKGSAKDITTEIMIWVHDGALTPSGEMVARYDGSWAGDIYEHPEHWDTSGQTNQTWRYIAVNSDADRLTGAVDIRDVLTTLKREGLLTGKEYLSGYELGAEIAGGKGSLTVKSVSETFSRYEVTSRDDVLSGTDGDDFINASTGDDSISGLSGDDILVGGKGSDTLLGGSGKDVLTGGLGRDRLDGGQGGDSFVFRSAAESTVGSERDVVTFRRSEGDTIDLSGIDADTNGTKGDQAFAWVNAADLGAGFTKVDGQLRFADGVLMGDVNGDGRADFHVKIIGAVAAADVML